MTEPMAGDRYRVRYEPGRSGFGGLFGRLMAFGPGRRREQPSRASEAAPESQNPLMMEEAFRRGRRGVFILDAADNPVWWKPVASAREGDDLVELIRQQVLNARLVDFEAWLVTQSVPPPEL